VDINSFVKVTSILWTKQAQSIQWTQGFHTVFKLSFSKQYKM